VGVALCCSRVGVPQQSPDDFEAGADRNLGSFKVNRFNGKWCDFATGDKGGDPVSLVAYVEGVSQLEAARLLTRMLGLDEEGARHG
jgi:hypothetical protein